MTREAAHDWAIPWVESTPVVDPAEEGLVEVGLQYLHGLDMTAANPKSPRNPTGHGGPGPYVLSEADVAATLDHWLAQCAEYDEDPHAFLERAYARALDALKHEQNAQRRTE